MNQAERRIRLINALLNERADGRGIAVPAGAGEQRDLLRALMNVRSPEALATEVLNVQDAYLQQRLVERGGATDASTLPPTAIALPSGVATSRCLRPTPSSTPPTAKCSAVCSGTPLHRQCHPHIAAGMQLRLICAGLMCKQGHEEPTARVKVTPAFNLPSSHIFHTVGPIVPSHKPGPREELLLRRCYTSCLEEATRRKPRHACLLLHFSDGRLLLSPTSRRARCHRCRSSSSRP